MSGHSSVCNGQMSSWADTLVFERYPWRVTGNAPRKYLMTALSVDAAEAQCI